MTNFSIDLGLEFEGLPTSGAIFLEPTHFQQARQLSNPLQTTDQQWQIYLNALALLSVEEWMAERASELNVNREKCTILQPDYAKIIPAVCNLQIGDFKLCLIAIGSLTFQAIALPRATIELSKFTAHFYVLLEILEELGEARIKGFLDYNQLSQHLNSNSLQPEENWTYKLPLDWWETNPDDLLLYLRCREPETIPLPQSQNYSQTTIASVKNQLSLLLPELQSCQGNWWEILSWEQGAILLSNDDLLQWLIANIESKKTPWQRIAEPFFNVGIWLRDELDEISRELSWVLLPTLASESRFSLNAPTLAMRSPLEELEAIVTFLERNGSNIPPNARAAYHNFQLSSIPLRLYAVTWSLLSPQSIPEWKLLLVLGGTPSNTRLPDNTRIAISHNQTILVEQIQKPENVAPYLYALVAGTWDEVFTLTITLADGTTKTLPPFAFDPT